MSLFFNTILSLIFFAFIFSQTTVAAQLQDPPPTVVTLENGYRITFLGVSNNFNKGTSTWCYRVEELPSAQDLSVWMLELPDCHQEEDVITATPSSWWYEGEDEPEPNMHLIGIKWQGAGVDGSAEFCVTLEGHWQVGINQVGAKGPDVAIGLLAGPSCRPFTPVFPAINFLLLRNSPLYINEFLAANAGTPEAPDWIEIYNSGGTAVDLKNFYLTNDLTSPTKYKIPTELTIPAGGFVVFYADNSTELGTSHTNFTLDTNSGDVALFGPDGITVVDSYTYGIQISDQSEGRCPDGGTTWTTFVVPTQGSTNGTCQ